MPGCERRATARASREKRARDSGAEARCGWSSFTATSRSRAVSRPRYTTAMPPLPTCSSSSYRPSMRITALPTSNASRSLGIPSACVTRTRGAPPRPVPDRDIGARDGRSHYDTAALNRPHCVAGAARVLRGARPAATRRQGVGAGAGGSRRCRRAPGWCRASPRSRRGGGPEAHRLEAAGVVVVVGAHPVDAPRARREARGPPSRPSAPRAAATPRSSRPLTGPSSARSGTCRTSQRSAAVRRGSVGRTRPGANPSAASAPRGAPRAAAGPRLPR